MEFIAHIRSKDGCIQTVEEHLQGVKVLTEAYGKKIGIPHITGLSGMLHDLGKYTDAFRNYLILAVHHPEAAPKRGSIDHSTAGGRLLFQLFHQHPPERYKALLAEIVGNAIISHHSYLHDYIDPELESKFLLRVRDKEDVIDFDLSVERFFSLVMSEKEFRAYVDQAAQELKIYLNTPSVLTLEQKCMFLSKFVFSALIDGDRTNTRRFEDRISDEQEQLVSSAALFQGYYDRLMTEIRAYEHRPGADTAINRLRRTMSCQCDSFAERPSGIYTLSIPTGGGKTLASLRYGLKHAIAHDKKRIIYILPFTTIIEQNAAEVRRILQDEVHILEHHSNVSEDNGGDDELEDGHATKQQKLKLAKDNWDSPVIFTTMVQFLNVFYAKGSRSVRRLHNLSESVLIFDEVQKVPVTCISLFNEALNFLHDFCHSSIVLCTATQPALDFVEHKLQIHSDSEIINNLSGVLDAFRRVELKDEATNEVFNTEKLAEFVVRKLDEKPNMLIILNTKSVVKKLYELLLTELEGIPVYHLSTSMCAKHRKVILDSIRVHLKEKERVVCISTALIEAGVDVSFSCVIRSLAGLDSIAQAAGRCNRHGEEDLQQVYVINHGEENLKHLPEIQKGKEISSQILNDLKRNPHLHGGSLLSQQAMTYYFQRFYSKVEESLDYPIKKLDLNMTTLLFAKGADNPYFQSYCANHGHPLPLFLRNSYRSAAEHFEVIDQPTTAVIVPYQEEGKQIISDLISADEIEDLGRLMRRAQQYTIQLFRHDLHKLEKSGGLEHCLDGKLLVLKDGAYNEEYGLDLGNDSWTGAYYF